MSSRYLMALDAGTGAARCFVVDTTGHQYWSTYQEWHYDKPPDAPELGMEFEAETFWQIVAGITREAIQQAGIDPADIVAVSTCSLREGQVLLDKAGREIFATPQRDRRGGQEAEFLSDHYGQLMNDLSGHWPSEIFAPARLLWLKQHRPHIYERADTLLMINDWLVYRLCGVRACEPTNAAETCLFDIKQMAWADDLIEAIGLPRSLFPPVCPAGTVVGEATPAAAAETGLKVGTAVVVGGADTQCGTLGSGAVRPGDITAVAGTSTPVQLILNTPVIDKQARTWSGPFVIPDHWMLESNAGVTGSWLQWFRDNFCHQEIAQAKENGGSTYDYMTRLAEKAPIGANKIFALMGPFRMNARQLLTAAVSMGGFVMSPPRALLTLPDTRANFIRALLETFAYAVRANVEQLEEISGGSISRLHVCGGAVGSDLWVDMLAGVCDVPVHVPQILEGSSIGAALCAGVGVGEYADFAEGRQALIHTRRVVEPDPALAGPYSELYQQWYALTEEMAALKARVL
jgi:sugar (pentulose or hexulose) kinase